MNTQKYNSELRRVRAMRDAATTPDDRAYWDFYASGMDSAQQQLPALEFDFPDSPEGRGYSDGYQYVGIKSQIGRPSTGEVTLHGVNVPAELDRRMREKSIALGCSLADLRRAAYWEFCK